MGSKDKTVRLNYDKHDQDCRVFITGRHKDCRCEKAKNYVGKHGGIIYITDERVEHAKG